MKSDKKIKILADMFSSLCKSWTYERMTPGERQKFADLVKWIGNSGPLDNMHTEKEIQFLVLTSYHSFLIGIGYTNSEWREPKESNR